MHYARHEQGQLAAAAAAVRARRSLEEMDGWLLPAGTAFLRTGEEMARRFARFPGVVQRAAVLGLECSFDLQWSDTSSSAAVPLAPSSAQAATERTDELLGLRDGVLDVLDATP